MCWQCSSSTYLLGGRSKSSGAFSGVFDISSAVWSIVSPIPGCGVAGSGSEASVLYLLTIIELLCLDRNWPFLLVFLCDGLVVFYWCFSSPRPHVIPMNCLRFL
jgi:hypothetical protein